jgi:hypothetical protein
VKRIISLCDYSGNWCLPYKEAGYEVIQIDLKFGQDVRLLKYMDDVYGVLAAPPCTVFCGGGSHLWHKRTDEEVLFALSIVDACVRIATMSKPTFWALENPPGRLNKWLGPQQYKFQPYEFGDGYSKLTYLWGKFNEPKKGPIVPFKTNQIEKMWGGKEKENGCRSETPLGFARAFFEANP